jgi:hypothetical protein
VEEDCLTEESVLGLFGIVIFTVAPLIVAKVAVPPQEREIVEPLASAAYVLLLSNI